MKSYRENELKYYVISCIFVFLWIYFKDINKTLDLWVVLNPLLISPVFYIFTILLDSLYSNDIKIKIIFLHKGLPSGYIFSEIFSKGNSPWFTAEEAQSVYPEIYHSMLSKNKQTEYQKREWYKIYIKYRDMKIEALDVNSKEYRLVRDINIATINLSVLYLFYCLISQNIYWEYIVFLVIAILVTNIAARNKGKRWVYNVISHDINHQP